MYVLSLFGLFMQGISPMPRTAQRQKAHAQTHKKRVWSLVQTENLPILVKA